MSVLYAFFYTLNAIKCLQSIKHRAHVSCFASAFPFTYLFLCSLNHFSLKISLLTYGTIILFFFSQLLNSAHDFCVLKVSFVWFILLNHLNIFFIDLALFLGIVESKTNLIQFK